MSDEEQKVIANFVKKIRKEQETHNLPRLSLQDYIAAFQEEDRPTDEQIENFIAYVADAHSWYKHLPHLPPGRPFSFFLDPCAGYAIEGSGLGTRRKEHDEKHPIHYNYRKTHEYRNSFGVLSYSHGEAIEPAIHIVGAGRFRLPMEVLSISVAELTCVIHDWTQNQARYWTWVESPFTGFGIDPAELPEFTPALEQDWPEEIGGNAFRDEFAERIRRSLLELRRIWRAADGTADAPPIFQSRDFEEGDPFGVKGMLKIMQAREFELMRGALKRVRELVFGS